MGNHRQYCKLCHKTTSNGSQIIDNIIRDILDIILLNLNLQANSKYLMCKPCSVKLLTAFEFKSACLSTDGCIIPYIVPENFTKIDLQNVYLNENKSHTGIFGSGNQKVCRLCMQLTGEFKPACDIEADVSIFIPEVNFHITLDPVICLSCVTSLTTHVNFIKDCLNKNNKSCGFFAGAELNTHELDHREREISIKTEEIEIKVEIEDK